MHLDRSTEHLTDLLVAMLQPDPSRRAKLEQARGHPWVQSAGGGADGLGAMLVECKREHAAALASQNACICMR